MPPGAVLAVVVVSDRGCAVMWRWRVVPGLRGTISWLRRVPVLSRRGGAVPGLGGVSRLRGGVVSVLEGSPVPGLGRVPRLRGAIPGLGRGAISGLTWRGGARVAGLTRWRSAWVPGLLGRVAGLSRWRGAWVAGLSRWRGAGIARLSWWWSAGVAGLSRWWGPGVASRLRRIPA